MPPLPRRHLALCLGLLLAATAAHGQTMVAPLSDNPAAPPPAAAWQHQQLTFDYRGFTTRYSCDGLRNKLRQVLQVLGARKDDLKVTPAGCVEPAGRPEMFPSMDLDFWSLQPVAAPLPPDTVKSQWHAVHLARQLDGGDCELADEIKRQLLPRFTIRNAQVNTGCIPHQAVGSVRLSLEVLVAASAH